MGTKGTTQRDKFSKDTLNAYIEGRVRELSAETGRINKEWPSNNARRTGTERLGACIRELRSIQEYFNLNR